MALQILGQKGYLMFFPPSPKTALQLLDLLCETL